MDGPTLFLGPNAGGVWKRSLSDFDASAVGRGDAMTIELKISPNPTQDKVTLLSNTANISRVSIVNLLGMKLMEVLGLRTPKFTLDLSTLPRGCYFVNINAGGSFITRKLVKE